MKNTIFTLGLVLSLGSLGFSQFEGSNETETRVYDYDSSEAKAKEVALFLVNEFDFDFNNISSLLIESEIDFRGVDKKDDYDEMIRLWVSEGINDLKTLEDLLISEPWLAHFINDDFGMAEIAHDAQY